jgi:predicted membrane protein
MFDDFISLYIIYETHNFGYNTTITPGIVKLLMLWTHCIALDSKYHGFHGSL